MTQKFLTSAHSKRQYQVVNHAACISRPRIFVFSIIPSHRPACRRSRRRPPSQRHHHQQQQQKKKTGKWVGYRINRMPRKSAAVADDLPNVLLRRRSAGWDRQSRTQVYAAIVELVGSRSSHTTVERLRSHRSHAVFSLPTMGELCKKITWRQLVYLTCVRVCA
jgi:hypothetical protein